MKDYSTLGMITMFIFAIIMIIIGPLVTALAINTLFNMGIPYTFNTWVAIAWLQLTLIGIVKTGTKQSK